MRVSRMTISCCATLLAAACLAALPHVAAGQADRNPEALWNEFPLEGGTPAAEPDRAPPQAARARPRAPAVSTAGESGIPLALGAVPIALALALGVYAGARRPRSVPTASPTRHTGRFARDKDREETDHVHHAQ